MTLRSVSAAGAPAVPAAAERARSLAERGTASVLPADVPDEIGRVCRVGQYVIGGGRTVLLLADDHPVTVAATEPRRALPVMLELADPAPVPLAERVRGLLWLTGWLRRLDRRAARRTALEIAASRPDPMLLDVNTGMAVLQLRTASLILADGEGTEAVPPDQFAAAEPDPFCRAEPEWLRHLERCHPDALCRLARHVPARLRGPGVRVRPLGLDRYGIRLRVEGGDRHGAAADVRLGFSRPVADSGELSRQIRALLACPGAAGG